jgi:hypothetical protein
MRLMLAALAAVALLPTASYAATVGQNNQPFVDVALGSAGIRLVLPAAGPDGQFRGSASLVLCDGSVRTGVACGVNELAGAFLSLSVRGSIFPEILGNVTFVDAGTPTALNVTFTTLIPTIPGAATTSIEGSFTVPSDRTGTPVVSPLLSGSFVEGLAVGPSGSFRVDVADGSITPDPLLPTTESWGPFAGIADCAAIDGCVSMSLVMGLQGLGGGAQYEMSGRFDLNGVPPTVVPLPAPLALLAAGLGLLLGAAVRRG